jgi:hypothetical protein
VSKVGTGSIITPLASLSLLLTTTYHHHLLFFFFAFRALAEVLTEEEALAAFDKAMEGMSCLNRNAA